MDTPYNLECSMTHHARIVSRSVGNFFIRPQSHFNEANLTSPAELRYFIESLKTKSLEKTVSYLLCYSNSLV
jgi:hypothetical protein